MSLSAAQKQPMSAKVLKTEEQLLQKSSVYFQKFYEEISKQKEELKKREKEAAQKIRAGYEVAINVAKELLEVKRTLGSPRPDLTEGKGCVVKDLNIIYHETDGWRIVGKVEFPICSARQILRYETHEAIWNLNGEALYTESARFEHPRNLPIGKNAHYRKTCQP